MRRALLASFLFLCAAAPASAKEWTVDYAHSGIGFIGTQGTSSFKGGFGTFTVSIDFDPDKPETGKITATINTSSATAGSSERDSQLPQADWFDVKQFPAAKFASTSIKKTGDHAYVAEGDLTIKDVTRHIMMPFTLLSDGDHWRAQGNVNLVRTDFHLGEHDWANENYVKYAVDVVIDISAKPQ